MRKTIKADWLIVGAGIYGTVFAQQAKERGKTCLIIDKRNHIAGNVYSEKVEGIDVHKYGPHLLNTNSTPVWEYILRFTKIIQYAHRAKVKYADKIYSMPINLQTMYEVYGTRSPEEAKQKIEEVRYKHITNPANLEEHCLAQIGPDLYELFIKHYTTKQWQRDPKQLPASIIKRLPVRYNYDDRWHDTKYSGIPLDGYTQWIANMQDGIDVRLDVDFFKIDWKKYANKVLYTGKIDELFNYEFGELDYRTLQFTQRTLSMPDYQGVAVVNYTDNIRRFTRTTEHKHFGYQQQNNPKTVVTWETPTTYTKESIPYYPINDDKNTALYKRYKDVLTQQINIVAGGRLSDYRYYDMDAAIASALKKAKDVIE